MKICCGRGYIHGGGGAKPIGGMMKGAVGGGRIVGVGSASGVIISLTVLSSSSAFMRPRSRMCSHQKGVKNVTYALFMVRAALARL